jgi:hypothetical protein
MENKHCEVLERMMDGQAAGGLIPILLLNVGAGPGGEHPLSTCHALHSHVPLLFFRGFESYKDAQTPRDHSVLHDMYEMIFGLCCVH